MKKKIMLVVSIIISIFLGGIIILYDYTHYNHSMERIFEIPDTCNIWESGDTIRCDKYFFIQSPPESQQEIELIINDFVEQNYLLNDFEEIDAEYIALNFMTANYRLPIRFEENKNYFNMDDHIDDYIKTNRIALFTYNTTTHETSLSVNKEPK